MTCLIAGDSIAAGIHYPSCTVNAKIGIPSAAIVSRVSDADLVVISAGSNDPDNPHLIANLRAMRAKIKHGRALWIVPMHPKAAAAVRLVANESSDGMVTFAPARDGVHPHTYGGILRAINGALK